MGTVLFVGSLPWWAITKIEPAPFFSCLDIIHNKSNGKEGSGGGLPPCPPRRSAPGKDRKGLCASRKLHPVPAPLPSQPAQGGRVRNFPGRLSSRSLFLLPSLRGRATVGR